MMIRLILLMTCLLSGLGFVQLWRDGWDMESLQILDATTFSSAELKHGKVVRLTGGNFGWYVGDELRDGGVVHGMAAFQRGEPGEEAPTVAFLLLDDKGGIFDPAKSTTAKDLIDAREVTGRVVPRPKDITPKTWARLTQGQDLAPGYVFLEPVRPGGWSDLLWALLIWAVGLVVAWPILRETVALRRALMEEEREHALRFGKDMPRFYSLTSWRAALLRVLAGRVNALFFVWLKETVQRFGGILFAGLVKRYRWERAKGGHRRALRWLARQRLLWLCLFAAVGVVLPEALGAWADPYATGFCVWFLGLFALRYLGNMTWRNVMIASFVILMAITLTGADYSEYDDATYLPLNPFAAMHRDSELYPGWLLWLPTWSQAPLVEAGFHVYVAFIAILAAAFLYQIYTRDQSPPVGAEAEAFYARELAPVLGAGSAHEEFDFLLLEFFRLDPVPWKERARRMGIFLLFLALQVLPLLIFPAMGGEGATAYGVSFTLSIFLFWGFALWLLLRRRASWFPPQLRGPAVYGAIQDALGYCLAAGYGVTLVALLLDSAPMGGLTYLLWGLTAALTAAAAWGYRRLQPAPLAAFD